MRKAKCQCGKIESNKDEMHFFDFTGDGSFWSRLCSCCGFSEESHKSKKAVKCSGYKPQGPLEFDKYYCGCNGWD